MGTAVSKKKGKKKKNNNNGEEIVVPSFGPVPDRGRELLILNNAVGKDFRSVGKSNGQLIGRSARL